MFNNPFESFVLEALADLFARIIFDWLKNRRGGK